MAYAIRPFADADAKALSELTHAAITQIGTRKYSQDQVDAWAARHPGPDRFRERAMAGHHIFVAVNAEDHAVAYALLEPDGHFDMLYCHPDHTRQRLAERLIAAVEQHAIGQGISRLFTEASELGRPAFERAGYFVIQRRDFTIAHGTREVAIHNYAIEKRLT